VSKSFSLSVFENAFADSLSLLSSFSFLSADSLTITPLLNRLLATDSNLHIILGGTSIGGFAELKALHEDGKLQAMLLRANVAIEPPKVVKKRRAAAAKKD